MMATYFQEKVRVFDRRGDNQQLKQRCFHWRHRRSESRLKTYPSATDARAWTNSTEDRRDYLLKIISADLPDSPSCGRFVPITTVIDTILASQHKCIEQQKHQIRNFSKLLTKLNLDTEQLKIFEGGDFLESSSELIKESEVLSEETLKSAAQIIESQNYQTQTIDQLEAGEGLNIDTDLLRFRLKNEYLKTKCLSDQNFEEFCVLHSNLASQALGDLIDLKMSAQKAKNALSDNKSRTESETDTPKSFNDIKRMEEQLNHIKKTADPHSYQLIEQELQILRSFCADLSQTRKENCELKSENSQLQQRLGKQVSKNLSKCSTNVVNIVGNFKEKRHKYKEQIKHLRSKVDQLEKQDKERSIQSLSLNRLNKEITSSEEFIDKVTLCDSVSQCDFIEPTKLTELQNYHELQTEVNALRVKAARTEQLEEKLEGLKNASGNVQTVQPMENRNNSVDMQILTLERDRLKLKLDEMTAIEKEYKNMKSKISSFENVTSELQFYKQKLEALEKHLRCKGQTEDYEDLLNQLKNENHQLKMKIVALDNLIANQEDEIDRLIVHLDRLVKSLENQQGKSKNIVNNLRAEIENKSLCIANMNGQLESLQNQLREVIEQVAKENSTVQERLKKAEASLTTAHQNLITKDVEIGNLQVELAKESEYAKECLENIEKKNMVIEDLIRQQSSDNHVTYESYEILANMLKKSQLALRKAAKQIHKQSLQLNS